MESDNPLAAPGVAAPPTIADRRFSAAIAITYVGLAFFGAVLLVGSFGMLWQLQLLLAPCLVFGLACGFGYVVLALRRRRNWSRYAAVCFWLIGLVLSSITIIRNGLHPEPTPGPFQYSNEDQLAGARFTAFVIPYVMVTLELSVAYCLLRKPEVVNQFRIPKS